VQLDVDKPEKLRVLPVTTTKSFSSASATNPKGWTEMNVLTTRISHERRKILHFDVTRQS
jgi:hypothetical protein